MNTIVVIIVVLTLLAVLFSIYLEIRRQIKPRIKVYFPGGSTEAQYKAKEEASVAIHIQNRGKIGLPKPAARAMAFFVYAPHSFTLKQIEVGTDSSNQVMEAPSVGIFKDMRYLQIGGDIFLFDKEEEVVKVLILMPENTGRYPLKVAILSAEGDLGVHELEIIAS